MTILKTSTAEEFWFYFGFIGSILLIVAAALINWNKEYKKSVSKEEKRDSYLLLILAIGGIIYSLATGINSHITSNNNEAKAEYSDSLYKSKLNENLDSAHRTLDSTHTIITSLNGEIDSTKSVLEHSRKMLALQNKASKDLQKELRTSATIIALNNQIMQLQNELRRNVAGSLDTPSVSVLAVNASEGLFDIYIGNNDSTYIRDVTVNFFNPLLQEEYRKIHGNPITIDDWLKENNYTTIRKKFDFLQGGTIYKLLSCHLQYDKEYPFSVGFQWSNKQLTKRVTVSISKEGKFVQRTDIYNKKGFVKTESIFTFKYEMKK